MNRHRFRYFLLLFAVAAVLRFAQLGSKSLWFDEAFSSSYANKPAARIINPTWTKPDPHPPLYYLGLHYWIGLFGDSETAVRMPSAMLSLGSVALLFLLGRRLFSPTIGLMAAGLLAVSPLSIWYAQEARMYAAVTFLGLLAVLWLTWDHWAALPLLVLTLTLGLYVDYTYIPLWMGISGVWLVHWWHRERRRRPFLVWLLASISAPLLYLPWADQFSLFLREMNGYHIFERLQVQVGLPLLSPAAILALALMAGAGFILVTAVAWRILERPQARRWLGFILLAAFVLANLLFALPRFYTIKRFILLGWPYVILAVSYAVWQLPAWRKRLWVGLMALCLAGAIIVLFLTPKDDWRAVADYLNGNVPDEAVVWIDPPWNRTALGYYAPQLRVQSGGEAELQSVTSAEVWLIAERFHGQTPPTSSAERIFDRELHLTEVVPFYRLQLRRYQHNASPGE